MNGTNIRNERVIYQKITRLPAQNFQLLVKQYHEHEEEQGQSFHDTSYFGL